MEYLIWYNFIPNGLYSIWFILTKIFLKKDIREIGSGNIGATNALRTGNKLIGYQL
jgi:glycerol-3-phosphate acyltransferase PlsY